MENTIFDLAKLRELEAFAPKDQLDAALKLFKKDYSLPSDYNLREVEDTFGSEDFYRMLRGYLPSKTLQEFDFFYSGLNSSVTNSYHIYNLTTGEVLYTDPEYPKCVFEYGKLNRGDQFGALEIVDDTQLKRLRSSKAIKSSFATFGAPVRAQTAFEGLVYISGYAGEKYTLTTTRNKYGSFDYPLSWAQVIDIYNRHLGVPVSFQPDWESRLRAYVDDPSTVKDKIFKG